MPGEIFESRHQGCLAQLEGEICEAMDTTKEDTMSETKES